MTTSDAQAWLNERLPGLLAADAASFLAEARSAVQSEGFGWLEVYFASLPRRVGHARAPEGDTQLGGRRFDLAARRHCDLVAADLLVSAELEDGQLETLFAQGDHEERRMILSALPLIRRAGRAADLLLEAHRTNDGLLFEVGLLDSDLPAAALDDESWNNVVMKAAFLDFAIERLFGWTERANAELSVMLLDFMAEREAAGRAVWGPSLEMAAHAPVPGVAERVLGDLWHGVDRRRLAAARAASTLPHAVVREATLVRRSFETHPRVLEVLPS